jgi:hypothetical protein
MNTRRFELGDILSVTTECLVSRRHIDGVYDILGYMTGETLFTHQLPRANDMCRPALLAQHPQLTDVRLPDEPESGWTQDTVNAWVDSLAPMYGRELEVVPLPESQRDPQNPIEELCDMVGPEKVLVFPVSDEGARDG